ncbi:MAG: DNA-directed RNA polymerase subunit H [Nanoarchaeota archaeon]|nr:DNA-directed RNA polymerase subunit H [Nanoarchaeota archaeon]
MAKFDVKNHILVPKHIKLSEKEKQELLQKYDISPRELPRILKKDPAIKDMDIKRGDVIKIIRKSQTSGEAIFYRCVVVNA